MSPGTSANLTLVWNETTIGTNGTWVITFVANPIATAGGEVVPTNSATLSVNSTYTVTLGNSFMGDLGGGVPPTFGKYDGLCDGKDLALFLQCYHGTAPAADMWLADLGGGVPPTFGVSHPGLPTGKDLALFLEVYHGTAPWMQ